MVTLHAQFYPDRSEEELGQGRLLFAGDIAFQRGVVQPEGLPEDNQVEICFCGRSNVGKSSLINALTNRKNLARTSNTPGRTQEINYFTLQDSHYLVDLPGYGYAKMPKSVKASRQRFLRAYLRGRASLRRVFVLLDARHGPKEVDDEIFDLLNTSAVSFQMVYTKIDKIKHEHRPNLLAGADEVFQKYPVALPVVLTTSSHTKEGIPYLRQTIAEMI